MKWVFYNVSMTLTGVFTGKNNWAYFGSKSTQDEPDITWRIWIKTLLNYAVCCAFSLPCFWSCDPIQPWYWNLSPQASSNPGCNFDWPANQSYQLTHQSMKEKKKRKKNLIKIIIFIIMSWPFLLLHDWIIVQVGKTVHSFNAVE